MAQAREQQLLAVYVEYGMVWYGTIQPYHRVDTR
jgi:hypothetical protein